LSAIHLGFEVGTGRPIEIPVRHMAITGQTQESGKTTTLEAAINRSGLRAVAYVTKRGESSFHVANPIPPYFLERADWKFVQSLLEAAMESRMDFKQPWIMRISDGASTLEEVRSNIRKFLYGVRDPHQAKPKRGKEIKERWITKPARGLNADVYYVLDKYFEEIMPQLAAMPYAKKLELAPGLNVMDLRDYEFPLQALVVRSVIDWVHDHGADTINVIPEAWKFAPKQKGSPVRQSAEEMIREGGALRNFLWIDSQDLAGVADVLMRQVGVWIFGVQRAKHEIERALDHMPEGLPARRPRPQDIATLSKGQFYVCFGREMYKVYVQPAWMTAAHAEAIARGEEEVASAPDILREYDREKKQLRDLREEQETEEEATEEESMYKEKAEELRKELKTALARISALEAEIERAQTKRAGSVEHLSAVDSWWKSPIRQKNAPAPRIGGEMAKFVNEFPVDSYEAIFTYIRKRVREDPEIANVLSERPELRVKVSRPVLSIDGASLYGRMALLVSEGFFTMPQSARAATVEAVRRGWCHPRSPVMRIQAPLDKLAGQGFLTIETDGYQIVSGVKISIDEVPA
jgi:hypothetical protein